MLDDAPLSRTAEARLSLLHQPSVLQLWDVAGADAAERQLSSFAPFADGLASWQTRLAAMQCQDTVARLKLGERVLKRRVRALTAEIAVREALPSAAWP